MNTKPNKMQNILLLNPFKYESENINIGVDPVVSRHSGQEIKTGVTFPIGLAYIAAMLLQKNFEVKILDPIAKKVSVNYIHNLAQWSDSIIMPFSLPHADDIKRFRNQFRNKLFILSGGYAKFIPDVLLKEDYCDVILDTEPELTTVELMGQYPHIENISGIIYKKNGQVIITPPRSLINDLDELPFPARGLLNSKLYWDISFFGRPTAWILPSRGCPFNCIFCAQFDRNTKSVRYRSARNIVDEIESVIHNFSVKNFVFFDETFNINDEFVCSICNEILSRKLRIKWWCAARADLIKEDVARLMKKAGCIEMRIGLESANNNILGYLQKDITIKEMRGGLKILKKVGINFSLHCIFGSPMENNETIKNTIKFLKEFRPLFASFNVLTPLPGSQLFNELKDSLSIEIVKSFDILHSNYSFCKYSPEELSRIIKKAYLSYYVSFSYLIRISKEILKNPFSIYFILKTLIVEAFYIYKSILRYKN